MHIGIRRTLSVPAAGFGAATWLVLTFVFGFAAGTHADVVVLYDDTQGNLPGNQPWLFYADDSIFGGSVSQSATANGVNLNSDTTVSAGYSNYIPIINSQKNPAFPVLNRNTGFRLSFELQVAGETHNNSNRAGFSVILLSHDMQGIELGFWQDEIWAQNDNPIFTHGEGISFDTTQTEMLYELLIQGNQYFLSANGTPILSNTLRDYTAFGSAPYTLGSYVFLGDDTGSAGANVNLGLVSLTTIPEPMYFWLVAAGGIVAGLRRRRI